METTIEERRIEIAYDNFINALIPFGSLDIRNCVTTALQVNIDMNKLVEIMEDYARETGINLLDSERTTDINAILNYHIIQQARNELSELLDIDIQNDYDTYFFANFLDCPLQYSEECKEALTKALKEKEIKIEDLEDCTQYVLSEMDVDLE